LTSIGRWTDDEFASNYPIDLGDGQRASYIANGEQEPVGLILAHRVDGGDICAASCFWRPVEGRPKWTLWIKEGKWVRAADSRQS
jgi:hypothetical protein